MGSSGKKIGCYMYKKRQGVCVRIELNWLSRQMSISQQIGYDRMENPRTAVLETSLHVVL